MRYIELYMFSGFKISGFKHLALIPINGLAILVSKSLVLIMDLIVFITTCIGI